MIYTVKDFGIANKADIFLELSCFFYDPMDAGNLISGFSAFSKSSLNIWKLSIHILLKPSLKDSEHYLACVCNECKCVVVLTLLLTFFGIGMKTFFFILVATAEFSKFACILSAALSQHHL